MKRFAVYLLSLALCLALLTGCTQDHGTPPETGLTGGIATTPAADYDRVIDAAISAGRIVLEEKTIPKPDPDNCTVIVPPREEYPAWENCPDEAVIRETLKTGDVTVLAYSPDGNTAVAYADSDTTGFRIPLLISGDCVTMMRPSVSRGHTEDEALSTYYTQFFYKDQNSGKTAWKFPLGIGLEGLTWSEDGRFFYVPNYNLSWLHNKSCHYIVDTKTGEIISLDTLSKSWSDDNQGFLSTGCFSEDGQSFFGIYSGSKYQDMFALIQYDLNTFEVVRTTALEWPAQTSLIRLRNGNLFFMEMRTKSAETQMLNWINADGTIRARQASDFQWGVWFGRQVEYSPKSGWAVIQGYSPLFGQYVTTKISGPGLQFIRPDEEKAEGLDSALFIDNVTREAVYASIQERFYPEGTEAGTGKLKEYDEMAERFLDFEMSPDGRYVALMTCDSGRRELTLRIIRISDKACLVAEGLEIPINESKSSFKQEPWQIMSKRSQDNLPIMNWTVAGLLIVGDYARLWQIAE